MLSMLPSALYAQTMSRHTAKADTAMAHISSGVGLQHTWDDPSDFALAENMHKQKLGAGEVTQTLQEALNIIRIGEDGVGNILGVLQDLRETLVQAANGSIHTEDQWKNFQTELDTKRGLVLQAFGAARSFRLRLDGSDSADRVLNFQVGTNAGEYMSVDYNPLRDSLRELIIGAFGYEGLYNDPQGQDFLTGLGVSPPPPPNFPVPPALLNGNPPGTTFGQLYPPKLVVNPATPDNFATAFALLDKGIEEVTQQASYLGNIANRMSLHITALQQFELDMAESESHIRDADLAVESTNLTKAQVLQQASQAMMAQANTRSLQILELLRQG